MLKKLVATLFLCFFLAGCGTFNIRVQVVPDATATAQGTAQPLLLTPTLEAKNPSPTATPFSVPSFGALIRFSAGDGKPGQKSFAPKTRQVFAAWEYANMRPGLTVLREWYLNGQLWLSREEPWDFARYGANGTISDVSVFDFDAGLPSGDYQLRLYIDGQPQFTREQSAEQSAFSIQGITAPILVSVRMSDTLRGWGIDETGKVLRTLDGGSNWQDRTPQMSTFSQHSFFALNSEAAWAVLDTGVIWRTQDGGQTWKSSQPVELPAEGKYQVLGLQFPDVRNGWVVFLAPDSLPNTFLFRTADGGETWSPATALGKPELASYLPDTKISMTFFDGQNGWIGGWWGKDDPSRWTALQTTNRGNSWQIEALPAIPNLLAGQPTTCDGWAISDMPAGSMAVEVSCTQKNRKFHQLYYLSNTTGLQWRIWNLSGAFIGADFLDNRTGWMMTSGAPGRLNEIYHTVDGGATWYKINNASWKSVQFDFVSDLVGWAIVGNGQTFALIHSVDGGKTWVEIKPVIENR